MANKVMSKRSGRPYGEDDTEKQAEDHQEKRMGRHEDARSEGRDRQKSTSTATTHSSQSSLEPSPVIRPADGQPEIDTLELGPPARSDSELRDAFHPTQQQVAYSIHELEKSLPTESRPANFGVVVPGVYRSSFPQSEDYGFIEGLKLKTIVTLVQKEFPQGYDAFLHRNDIKHAIFDMKGTKKEDIPTATMKSILRVVLDRRNHPLLIHCNHGKHRTGCVIGIIRKLSGWNLSNIITEYKAYAEPKTRECDISYITGFELANISNLFREASPPFRTTGFLRAVFFALVMLVVWLVSGPEMARDRIAGGSKREMLTED
ncbi:tyrosine phosphatase family-domain-containing protein [Parachaetomium inaequale]|uniref:diphosphoinositol-polyphosphate diphosphatase n=1 Tax=Parachaetomium inaequale TaxID=2588326 RepID=A0AAN6PAG5_9PEZI|nr:tyrosine phosphatase family-domain-containing protein [Parachaetomium inaequale]